MQREAELHADEDRQAPRGDRGAQHGRLAWPTRPRRRSASTATRSPPTSRPRSRARSPHVRSAIEADDADRMQSAVDALSTSLQKIGQAVYGAAGAEGPPDPTASPKASPEKLRRRRGRHSRRRVPRGVAAAQ